MFYNPWAYILWLICVIFPQVWDVTHCHTIPVVICALVYKGDVHLLLDVARQSGKCLFFTAHAADSILACVFHSADDVCTICLCELLILQNVIIGSSFVVIAQKQILYLFKYIRFTQFLCANLIKLQLFIDCVIFALTYMFCACCFVVDEIAVWTVLTVC